MNDNNKLLDKIVEHLRASPVPEMPPELVVNRTVLPRGWIGYGITATAVAVSVSGLLIWCLGESQKSDSRLPTVAQQQQANHRESDVVVRSNDLVKPLIELEGHLDRLDTEITRLHSKAEFLDIQQMADELLAKY